MKRQLSDYSKTTSIPAFQVTATGLIDQSASRPRCVDNRANVKRHEDPGWSCKDAARYRERDDIELSVSGCS